MMSAAQISEFAEFIADAVAQKLSNQPRLVDRYTLSGIIGLSVPTIDRRVRDGSIPVIRSGNRTLFDPEDVVAALKRGGDDHAAS